MSAFRTLAAFAVTLALASCQQAVAPAPEVGEGVVAAGGRAEVHPLVQDPNAPPLETYSVSFMAVKGRSTTVKIKYKDLAGGSRGTPFLQFDIPRDGLSAGPDGRRLRTGDSLQIRLTIDLTTFKVDFEPSGIQFNPRAPAGLMMWFGQASPDLNGDGVVDGTDLALRRQLSIWYTDPSTPWEPLSSVLDPVENTVWSPVYHFSGYAVSW